MTFNADGSESRPGHAGFGLKMFFHSVNRQV